jgi:hypothetical protein
MVMTLVSAAIFGGGATAPATEPAMPAHLRAALEIATQIKAADNEYAHADCFIHWKGVDGADKFANRTDCSDFFNLLLEHSYSYTSKDFKAWTGATRPTATLWYDAAEKGTAKGILSPLKKVSDLLPGDLIFIKYPPGEADTGHVMLVAAAAKARAASEPVETGTRQWEIGVVDSSKSGHGTTDTRHNADGTYSQGVGKGIWRLYTKDDGTPAGYAWSTLKASKFVPVSEHAVILARLSVVKG